MFALSDKENLELLKANKPLFSDPLTYANIPDAESTDEPKNPVELKETYEIQLNLAIIGQKLGFKVWMPQNDRTSIEKELKSNIPVSFIKYLPSSFSGEVLKVVKNIDVIWIKEQSIVRAFEVENTTQIYSGLLRMFDLFSMAPNLDLKMHIVAPLDRRERVFQEIHIPTFCSNNLDLHNRCSFLSFEAVNEIFGNKYLENMKEDLIDKFTEKRDY